VKIVFDTSVLYAAFTARSGLCAQLLEICLARQTVVLSAHVLAELERHLAAKAKLSVKQLDSVKSALANPVVQVVTPALVPADACRDPDDLPILGSALAVMAEMIVTGDRDLLDLGTYRGTEIVTPRVLFDRLTAPPKSSP
jgi:putative PIN family toxin of toxin-antitoxin system